MHSSVLLVGILTLVSFSGHLPRSNAVPARLQELLEMPDIDQNRRPDLTKKLDELQGLLELQAQEYPQKLCQPDKPASPCCEYLETLKGNSRSESAIRLNEKRDGLKCWPGIAFCKKNVRSRQVLPAQNWRRSMPSAVKCRPGVSACRKGKRTLPKVFARSVQCVPGFPWCG